MSPPRPGHPPAESRRSVGASVLSWNSTNACSLACAHCYRDAGGPMAGELSTGEAVRLVEGAAEAGFRIFIFSGGEPLLRPDLELLVRRAADRGLRPVLGTSGVGLDRARVRELLGAGLARAGISLDSPDPAVHDAFRGTPGAWRAAVAACGACAAEGLPFQIHSTLTRLNRDDLEALFDLSARLGAVGMHLFFPVRVGRGRCLEDPAEDRPLHRETLLRIRALEERGTLEIRAVCAPQYATLSPRGTRGGGCLAGRSYAVVAPDGELRPCAYFEESAGNVRETPLPELWRSAPLFRLLRSEAGRAGCSGCTHRESCGGCRARALAETGDATARDPLCGDFRTAFPGAAPSDPQGSLLSPLDRSLAERLQAGIPLVEAPYAALASELGVDEARLLESLRRLLASDRVRFFGGFLSPRALGLSGSLCALSVPEDQADRVAAVVNALPQVTHNYLREGKPDLWFTLLARSGEERRRLLAGIEAASGLPVLLDLPVRETLKLKADFRFAPARQEKGEDSPAFDDDFRRSESPEGTAPGPEARPRREGFAFPDREPLSSLRRALIGALQRGFPATSRPFAEMGDILGVTEANVLSEVRALSKVRILRRIGLSLHHLRLGYAANALTAFDAQEDRLVALRKGVGDVASVSHCYIRETSPEWPWNLYAVFHGTDREECLRAIEVFRSRFSLGKPKILFSLKECKKSRWFLDEIDPPDPGHPA